MTALAARREEDFYALARFAMEEAKKRLGNLTVAEVARRIGFSGNSALQNALRPPDGAFDWEKVRTLVALAGVDEALGLKIKWAWLENMAPRDRAASGLLEGWRAWSPGLGAKDAEKLKRHIVATMDAWIPRSQRTR